MDHHQLLAYCTGRPGAQQARTTHGHDEVLVGGEAFAVFGPEAGTVTLKCGSDADGAQWWRDAYPDDVLIAPYIGQYGWNTFSLSADIDDAEFYRAVDTSYADVVQRGQDADGSAAGTPPPPVSGEATS
jgi:predicted DNA-binding protein (MmcQ/YjbR family)